MASETVRQGRAAWERLKRGSRDWSDWKIVGAALLEVRAITMRDAGATRARGGGVGAFSDWLINNRFNLKPTDRYKLLEVMQILPAVETRRATLTEKQRLRMTTPAVVLRNYRKATAIKPALERVISALAPQGP